MERGAQRSKQGLGDCVLPEATEPSRNSDMATNHGLNVQEDLQRTPFPPKEPTRSLLLRWVPYSDHDFSHSSDISTIVNELQRRSTTMRKWFRSTTTGTDTRSRTDSSIRFLSDLELQWYNNAKTILQRWYSDHDVHQKPLQDS